MYGTKQPTGSLGSQHILKLSEVSVDDTCSFADQSVTRFTSAIKSMKYQRIRSSFAALPHAFQVNSPDKSFHVYAGTAEEKVCAMPLKICHVENLKREWVKLLKQTIRNTRGWNEPAPKAAAVWIPDSQVTEVRNHFSMLFLHVGNSVQCMVCSGKCTLTNRRHHCRSCGKVLCSGCSTHKAC